MDSKVWHNSAEVDKYVHDARDEVDKKVQWEREEMDKHVRQERAAVDRVLKQEREMMDWKLKHIHEETEKNMRLEREEMDQKVKQERAVMDRALKQEREKMEKHLKKIQKDMDQKLQHERDEMDCNVELKRAKMDCKNMQARADMDQKLQQEREDMESKALLEQVRKEAKMMQDHARINPKTTADQTQLKQEREDMESKDPLEQVHKDPAPEQFDSYSLPAVVMDFSVYVDRKISDIPKGYLEGRPGSMIVREPGEVGWALMVEHLYCQGYKRNADLYYIEPSCIPPNGMVLMSGPEQVEQMMQAHKGRKKCDLYIVRNGPPSYYSDDGMSEEDQFNQNSDSCEPTNRGESDVDEDGSSARMEQPALSTHKKALTFRSDDEQTGA